MAAAAGPWSLDGLLCPAPGRVGGVLGGLGVLSWWGWMGGVVMKKL